MADSPKLEAVGVLYKDLGTQRVSDKMEKREFVIETTDEQYPQLIKFELVNDKCKILDGYNSGEKIKVSFNLRGREWKKDASSPAAYFTTLHAWRIERIDGGASNGGGTSVAASATPPPNHTKSTAVAEPGGDDLPF